MASTFKSADLLAHENAVKGAVTSLAAAATAYGSVYALAQVANLRPDDVSNLLARTIWSFPEMSAIATALGKTLSVGIGSTLTAATVNNKALTSNVATLTTAAAHGFSVGNSVVVVGVGAPFDGTYTLLSVPTTTTFTYAKTNANVTSAAATGNAVSLV